MEDIETKIANLPHSPGVYIYKNTDKEIIYIGKAINLSKRVKQYFQREDAVGDKTPQLVSEIRMLDTIETSNEFDALLLEAKLIKEYQPKYNVIAKDDKSPLYVIITLGDQLPRVLFGRKPKKQFADMKSEDLYFGPFQSAKTARNLLRSIRRVVPYCTQKQRTGKKCFYTHLGLCSPCPSYLSKLNNPAKKEDGIKEYRKNIFRIRDILSGKAVQVIHEMELDMKLASSQEKFEDAASLRNQISALRSLLSKRYDPNVYIQSDTLLKELVNKEKDELISVLQHYYPQLKDVNRIECYDISNTMGTYATASMVVMTDGDIDTDEYRKFRMRTKDVPNDFAMMNEVIKRRFNHPEWEYPSLIVIDGGKGQVSAALEGLHMYEHAEIQSIPIIGLAKKQEEIIVPSNDEWKIIRLPFSSSALKLLQRLRDEAHRFAITYHKLLRSKASLAK